LVPPGSWRLPEELFDNIEITNINRKPACWRTAENQGTKFKKYVVVVIHPAAKAAGILTTRQLNTPHKFASLPIGCSVG